MKVGIVGTGYVGTTVGTGFASKGHDVTFIDIDEEKVEQINKGELPLHDRTLEEPFGEVYEEGRLAASTDYGDLEGKEVVFLTLPTPSEEDGSINLDYVEKGARSIGKVLEKMDDPLVVVKSTVLPQTTQDLVIPGLEEESGLVAGEDFGVCMNPEFLREGSALDDFVEPDRVVIGELDEESGDKLEKLYEDFDAPVVRTGLKEAEMIKYASNSLLATKISFSNEIGNLCKELGIDTYEVMDAVGMDHRLNRDFLNSGVGFGGSCLVGDEKIMIENSGDSKLLSFEEFFENYTNDGGIKKDAKVLSFNEDAERFEFSKIRKATKREYSDEIYEIKTSMNKKVKVTKNHPMIVGEGGELKTKLARDLQEGDRIPLLREIPEKPKDGFDLIDLIKDSNEFENSKVYLKINYNLSDIKDDLRNLLSDYNSEFNYDKISDFLRGDYLPLGVFLEIEDGLPFGRSDLRIYTSKGSTTYVPAIIDSDRDFWRFIGYYLSEGCINEDNSGRGNTRKRIMISFNYEGEEEYAEDVESYLDRLGIKYRTKIKETSTQITFSSRILAHFLTEYLGCGTDSYTAKVPDLAYQESEGNRKEILSGLFRGDGYIAFPNYTNAVVYDYGSIHEELIQGMEFLLHSLDIVPSYGTSESKKSTAPAHFLGISTKAQVEKLKSLFLEEDRRNIQKRLDNYKREIKPTGHKREGGITTVKVKEIKKEDGKIEVYSLEADGNHNFVTTDGLLVHNCFPKDVKAIVRKAEEAGMEPKILKEVLERNQNQRERFIELTEAKHGKLDGKDVGILGLSFKPGTDDIRRSPAITVIGRLLDKGCRVHAHDPKAMDEMKKLYPNINYYDTSGGVVRNSEVVMILTDWPQFEEVEKHLEKHGKKAVEGRRMFPENERVEGMCW